jgi:salicylate hydroxylase
VCTTSIKLHILIIRTGLWSNLRSHMLGHESPPQPTGDLAYRGTFSLAALQALDEPAVDELCKHKMVTMWIGPKSHAVFYPVKNGTEFNLVMTLPDDLPEHVRTAPGDLQEMRAAFEGWDPMYVSE